MMTPPTEVLLPETFRHCPLWAACKTLSEEEVIRPDEKVQRKFAAVVQGSWTMYAKSAVLAPLTLAHCPLDAETI
jgi:hypothetical protein